MLISAASTLGAALLAFFGAQILERRRRASEQVSRDRERQVQFQLSLLGEIQALLDELSTLNAGNAGRLIDSSKDRTAKLAHMARVSATAERIKLRCAHFGQGFLYDSLDQVSNISMGLAGAEDFDAALSENARLYEAMDMAANELANKRRRLLGDALDGSLTDKPRSTVPDPAPGA